MGRLKGKVAVITGAASGIGRGAVDLFIKEGASVVAADIQDDKGARIEEEHGQAVRYIHCDVTQEADIKAAMAKAAEKREIPALKLLRLEAFREGKAMQTLYLGPYADEGPTIAALHEAIADAGHKLRGKHHEIYMSDPRRTAPAKLKTIIRQPYG